MADWSVVHVKALPGHQLELTFADGLHGVLDMSGETFDGVLAPLANPVFFAQAALEHGAVTWPGGLDLAPDAMYDDVRRQKNRIMA